MSSPTNSNQDSEVSGVGYEGDHKDVLEYVGIDQFEYTVHCETGDTSFHICVSVQINCRP